MQPVKQRWAFASMCIMASLMRSDWPRAWQWTPPPVPDPTVEPLWHVPGTARGSPAVDGTSAYFLTKTHEVVVFDAGSGRPRWRQVTGEPGDQTFGSALVLTGELVVAGDYNLIAFDRASGEMRWRFTPSEGYGPGIYLGATASGLVFTGSPAGRVYAVDARLGALRWSAAVARDDRTTVYQPVTDGAIVVAGYTLFGPPNTGGVVALDAGSGRERWRTMFPRPDDASLDTNSAGQPILVDDLVIAPSGDGVIYAFDRAGGSVRWSIPRLGGSIEGIITTTNRDYRAMTRSGRTLVAGSLTGYVVAYDLDTRQERWRYAGGYNGSTAYSLSSDTRAVYVPYVSGFLVAIDLARGAEIWRTRDWKAGFLYPPTIVEDTLFVGGARAGFYALSAATGGGR